MVGACRSVVPRAFFGSKRNERRYYRALDAFYERATSAGVFLEEGSARCSPSPTLLGPTPIERGGPRRTCGRRASSSDLLPLGADGPRVTAAPGAPRGLSPGSRSPEYRSKTAWRAAELHALEGSEHLQRVPREAPRPPRSAKVRGVPKPSGRRAADPGIRKARRRA